MNKKLFLLAAAFLMSVTVMFAQEVVQAPTYLLKELQKEFKVEGNVQWKMVDQFYKASFTSEGTPLEAFYAEDGTLIATSRRLTVEQLPMILMKEVKEKAKTHSVSELFELLTERGTEYYLIVSNEKETKKFRSEGTDWTRF